MKYKVIGWTSCDDYTYDSHEPITEPVELAIIENIKENGYMFGGDAHENYCPVLNDGTRVIYSWRSWGRVMGRAHGDYKGGYDYMHYYMDELIKPECRVYPSSIVDKSQIVPKESLKETFTFTLSKEEYDAVELGELTVLARAFDQTCAKIDVEDYILICSPNVDDEPIKMCASSIELGLNFNALLTTPNFSSDDCQYVLKYSPQSLGLNKDATEQQVVEYFTNKYGEGSEGEIGTIAISIKKPTHACITALELKFGDDFNFDTDNLCDIIVDIENELENFTDQYTCANDVFQLGINRHYEQDVNLMIKKIIGPFVGKELQIKQLNQKFNTVMELKISPYIRINSIEPMPNLTLNKDIVEFLYKSGIKVVIDYTII